MPDGTPPQICRYPVTAVINVPDWMLPSLNKQEFLHENNKPFMKFKARCKLQEEAPVFRALKGNTLLKSCFLLLAVLYRYEVASRLSFTLLQPPEFEGMDRSAVSYLVRMGCDSMFVFSSIVW